MLRIREKAHKNRSPQEKVRHISIVTRLLTGRTLTTGEDATRSSEGGNKEHNLTLTDTKPNEEIEKEEEKKEN
jgi:hypothetical protein